MPFIVGQLVELTNQPPNYGRSLDGTLARVEGVPALYKEIVFVELYRRHRRTGKALALKSSLMPVDQLRPVTEISPERAELLTQVEVLKREQLAKRAAMKADRLTWEQRILAMAQPEEPTDPSSEVARLALAELERELTERPPPGISSAEISKFFHRHRASLLDALTRHMAC